MGWKILLNLSCLSLMISLCFACGASSTGSRKPNKPFHGILTEPMADVWLGAIEFVDFTCGLPTKPDTPNEQPTANPLRNVPSNYANQIAQSMKLPTGKVNPYKFDHSFVYFRGKTFEWGASVVYDYGEATIGRDPHVCPAIWSLQRGSNCTLDQAEKMARDFGPIHGAYHLFTNNCHHFAEWLMKKLIAGDCILK
ncbi:uncharacterized protein LOC121431115 [Lytechinus variegatus]|uniref:uncharacterized protein LOC121431115 n=1 Tax=Lytechinus variegatus TaxID=7654 RepID=UPI001BB270FC|nr:uncharacterized protein LOC121431115 [Lytechinus variegatus]